MGSAAPVTPPLGSVPTTPLDALAAARPDLALEVRNVLRDAQGCVCILRAAGDRVPRAPQMAARAAGFCQAVEEMRAADGERVFALACHRAGAPGRCALREGARDADAREPLPAALLRAPVPLAAATPAPALGPRELETARLAVAMGYYQSPRRCTMEDIAKALGITKSAVYHRMAKVERHALAGLLEDGGDGA